MENKLQTAEMLLDEKYPNFEDLENGNIWVNIEKVMIEFAKLHCEAQSKTILEKVKTMIKDYYTNNEVERLNGSEIWDEDGHGYEPCYIVIVDKDSIKNAYPLENIK